MRTTGKFDCEGKEIFEGDKIINWWGDFKWKGKFRSYYQIHTIVARPAHMMANGEMHDDGGGIIFCMGNCYNFWEGKSVKKLTQEEIDDPGVKEDTHFFWDDDGKIVVLTDQHFMGLSDEEWEKELNKRKEWFKT